VKVLWGTQGNGERIQSFDYFVSMADVSDDEMLLRAGKKIYHKLKVEEG
jgi:tyrosyl-tRNA synthetase